MSCNLKVSSSKSAAIAVTTVQVVYIMMLPEYITLVEQHFSTNKLLSGYNSLTRHWKLLYVRLG
jgi:hypothetical protein